MKTELLSNNKIAIVGAGGLGKEVLCTLGELIGWENLSSKVSFLVEDKYFAHQTILGIKVHPLSIDNTSFDGIIIAIGDLEARMRIMKMFPAGTNFISVIHPGVLLTPYTQIGEGAIVIGNVLLSCDVKIGNFAIINPGTTISHDTTIGEYFRASPGVNISGGCKLGDRVFMGTGACLRDYISIANDVTIGMGAVVTKDILEPGTYIGNPARLI
jgi:sugar O-acyltransferase (sialic acid O-acetyltransferase NeuD family)